MIVECSCGARGLCPDRRRKQAETSLGNTPSTMLEHGVLSLGLSGESQWCVSVYDCGYLVGNRCRTWSAAGSHVSSGVGGV